MTSKEVKLIKSGRGRIMQLEGHQYYSMRKYKNGHSIWRCKNYKSLKCTGSVTMNMVSLGYFTIMCTFYCMYFSHVTFILFKDLTNSLQSKPHCGQCNPDETRNTINIIISNACDEAATGREPAPRVYNRALITLKNQGLHLASTSIVPEFCEMKSRIYRRRNKLAQVKKINAKTVEEVEVPSTFSDFLLADYRHKKMRIIVFCSSDAREIMKKIKHLFMDGTFKSCPRPFQQLFTIHGDIGSDTNNTNVIPLVYAFMTHRTKTAYSLLFNLIASQIPEWRPAKVTIDFEEGTMKALTKFNVTVKGCYYHYVNSLWRKAKILGLSKDKHKRRIISLCTNLALLPENEIVSGWGYIQNEMMENCESMMKFKDYFDNYWMKGDYHTIWSVYGERHRTNNAVEGWHHKINNLVTKGHVNLLQILHILRDDSLLSSYRNNVLQTPSTSKKRCKRRKTDLFNDDYIIDAQMQLISGQIGIGHFLEKMRL